MDRTNGTHTKDLLTQAARGDKDSAAAWFFAHEAAIRQALSGKVPQSARPSITTHNLLDTVRDMFVIAVTGEKTGVRLRALREYDAMRIVDRIARGVLIRYESLAETLPRAVRDVAELADALHATIAGEDTTWTELTVEEVLAHCGDDRARQLIVLVLQGSSLSDAADVLNVSYNHAKAIRRRAILEVRSYVTARDGRRGDT